MTKHEGVEIEDVIVKHETAAAILCVIDRAEVWVPKSQILDESEVYKMGTDGKLVITEWFAIQEKLV